MEAATYNLTIEQGATFSQQIAIKDGSAVAINLTGSTFAGQIRSSASSPTLITAITCTIDSPASNGLMTISLTAAQTALIPVAPSNAAKKLPTVYCYDIEWTRADASIVRLLQGTVSVSPEVTR